MSNDDDLQPWRDEPIVKALTGPATPGELAGEADALAAFRESAAVTDPVVAALTSPGTPEELAGEAAALDAFRAVSSKRAPRTRRRYVGRLGVSGAAAAAAAAVVFSGGAAAAYTASLPQPVQNFLHHVTHPLGAVRVPAKHKSSTTVAQHNPGATSVAPTITPSPTTSSPPPTGAANPTTSPSTRATPRHTAPAKLPKPTPTPSLTPPVIPTTTPTPSPSPTDTASPSPTPTDSSTPVVGAITIAVNATTVTPGGTVSVSGHVAAADGSPVSGEQVWLLQATAGEPGAQQVDTATTNDDGNVTLTTTAMEHSALLQLVTADKQKSAMIDVAVQATIMATVADSGSSASVQIATTGAAPGDSVTVQRRVDGAWQDVATNELDATGRALFGLQPPTGSRPDHWRAVLPRSKAHSGAITSFIVTAGWVRQANADAARCPP